MSAVSEEEKGAALAVFSKHLEDAKKERDYYRECTKDVHDEFKEHQAIGVPNHNACSQNLHALHYTLDIVQQVTLPSTSP